MLFWDVWGLTFMDTEMNISDLEPTQTTRRQGKGEQELLLPSVAPISTVPFSWLKHHSVSWVSAPSPESNTRRHLGLGEGPQLS